MTTHFEAALSCRIPVRYHGVGKAESGSATVCQITRKNLTLECSEKLPKGARLWVHRSSEPQKHQGRGPASCLVVRSRRQPRQSFNVVSLDVVQLRGTWLEPILEALDYADNTELPGHDQLSELLQEAQEKLKLRAPLAVRVLSAARGAAPASDKGLSVVERRGIGRLYSRFDVLCRCGERTWPATVVDLSPVGLALECNQAVEVGARVTLEPPPGLEFQDSQAVTGEVSYARKQSQAGPEQRFGMVLEESDLSHTWLKVALRFLGFSRAHLEQKRRYVRARSHLPVEAHAWGGDVVPGFFLDLGRGGALLQSPRPWLQDEELRLVIGPLGKLPLLYLGGVVLHQERRLDADEWYVRLRFTDIEGPKVKALDKYILTLLKGSRANLPGR